MNWGLSHLQGSHVTSVGGKSAVATSVQTRHSANSIAGGRGEGMVGVSCVHPAVTGKEKHGGQTEAVETETEGPVLQTRTINRENGRWKKFSYLCS